MVFTDDDINKTNNLKSFPEIRMFFEEYFDIKVQEGSVLKCLVFRIFQYTIGLSIDHTYHIMKLLNEWFPTGNA